MAEVVDDAELKEVIKTALPHITDTKLDGLVHHLMSPSVGVTEPNDLKFVKDTDLQNHLGTVQITKLLKAFSDYEAISTPSLSLSIYEEPSTSFRNQFSFTVPWRSLPQDLIKNMKAAEEKALTDLMASAHPNDRQELKLSICKKLASAYREHIRLFPGCSKTPGMKVYKDITDQVFKKFPHSLSDKINNAVVGDGKQSFTRSLYVCISNMFRNITETEQGPSAKVGKGIVGVLKHQYSPEATEKELEEQKKIRDALARYHRETRKSQWNSRNIHRDMHQTYPLQRKDIIKTTKTLSLLKEQDTVDDPQLHQMAKLKQQWPFLFELRFLTSHHQLLSGHLMDLPLNHFMENDFENLVTYLTTMSTNSSVLNLSLKLKWEAAGKKDSTKFLLAFIMLSNYFKEDYKKVIFPVEKTTQQIEIKSAIVNLPGSPCLVVLDTNVFAAESFYPCIDQYALGEEGTASEAMRYLFEATFVFDAEYDENMPRTMEFLERVVFRLGLQQTKIKQKQKQILVISYAVLTLVNTLKTFKEELKKAMNES